MTPQEIMKQFETFDPTLSNEMLEKITALFEENRVPHYDGIITLITMLGNTLGEMVKNGEAKGGPEGFLDAHNIADYFVKSLETLICMTHGEREEKKVVH